MADTKKIVLGSGKLYVTTATAVGGVYTIPDDATLETDTNLLKSRFHTFYGQRY